MNEIGALLKSKRETTGISLEEAGKDLEIKPVILDNIENGNVGCFKDIYVLKDNIKTYAKYLGIDTKKIESEFNDYVFESTSKIPIEEIEEKMKEKKKQEDTKEIKIASPYTEEKKKTKSYALLYILIIFLIAIAIFWSVKQITVDNKIATMNHIAR